MTDQTAESYMAIFDYIEKNIFKLGPSQFMTDFEAALRSAINRFYPKAILNGCWYHFSASIRRRFMSVNLYSIITDNLAARSIYRKILCLPLLLAHSIIGGFEFIKNEARENKLYKTFKIFFDYFHTYWMRLVRFIKISIKIEHMFIYSLLFYRTNTILYLLHIYICGQRLQWNPSMRFCFDLLQNDPISSSS